VVEQSESTNLNPATNFIIKPNSKDTLYKKPNFHPQQRNEQRKATKEPFTNSFVIIFKIKKMLKQFIGWLYSL
jgi:hypothetical protein